MQINGRSTHYHSDQPVSNNVEDRFQRYNFARRIAQTIQSNSSSDALVIGIYGSWGEGKTSVLNFIEKELEGDKDQILVKFNPWRFSEEQTLMLQFFNTLAKSVDARLKSGKEVFGTYMKKYSKLINFNIPGVGNLASGIEGLGNLLDSADLEQQKKVANEAILKANKRITIIVDDIDRLDKAEIQAIFRLVKLNADFANTTYILSFDEKMVAAAIGEKFAGGGEIAGKNFLEKIIQVPLRLPMIRPELIQTFCLQQIEKHLSHNGILLDDDDNRRFMTVFTKAILPKLNTPRIATRYSNTLSFSIPLLKGEVSVAELMMTEALKIFYPGSYNVVRYNPDIFLGTRQESEEERPNLDIIQKNLSEIDQPSLDRERSRVIIDMLFPEARYRDNSMDADALYNHQSIASPSYFERYFTYAVIEGDLSDVSVKAFVSGKYGSEQSEKELKGFLANNPSALLLRKLWVAALSSPGEDKEVLSMALARHLHLFSNQPGEGLNGRSSIQVCKSLISQLISGLPEDRFESAVKSTFGATTDMDFIFELASLCLDATSNRFFSIDEDRNRSLNKCTLDRALELSNDEPVFKVFPIYGSDLLWMWNELDKKGLEDYMEDILYRDDRSYVYLLKSFGLLYLHGGARDMTKRDFRAISDCVGENLLASYIQNRYSLADLSAPVKWEIQRNDSKKEDVILLLSLQFMSYHNGGKTIAV